jgi:Protein of unknown function (DUF3467)
MAEEQISPEIVQQLAGLSFTRSPDYKTIYSNLFRTRIGSGDISIVFSRNTHTPSLTATANIVEEQVEVVMSGPQLKMLEQMLHTLVDTLEQEVGEIQIPMAFKTNLEAQRAAIRSLGFPSLAKKT